MTASAKRILQKMPDVVGVFCGGGLQLQRAARPTGRIIFATLKPFSERKGEEHGAAAVIERVRGPLMRIPEAIVVPFAASRRCRAWAILAAFSSWCRTSGGNTLDGAGQCYGRTGAARQRESRNWRVCSPRSPRNDPQFVVTIDREKAKSLHVPFSQITDALQIYMGSQYVNDFDFNNRSYRVYVQADQQFRSQPRDLRQFYVRSDDSRDDPAGQSCQGERRPRRQQ